MAFKYGLTKTATVYHVLRTGKGSWCGQNSMNKIYTSPIVNRDLCIKCMDSIARRIRTDNWRLKRIKGLTIR